MKITQAMIDDYDSAMAYDENELMNKVYYDFELRLEGMSFSECHPKVSKSQVDKDYLSIAQEVMTIECDHLKYEILCLKDNKLMSYVPLEWLGALYEKVHDLVD